MAGLLYMPLMGDAGRFPIFVRLRQLLVQEGIFDQANGCMRILRDRI